MSRSCGPRGIFLVMEGVHGMWYRREMTGRTFRINAVYYREGLDGRDCCVGQDRQTICIYTFVPVSLLPERESSAVANMWGGT
jgi:hypothetical protein